MDEMKEKKISWNISKAMSSVYQSLNGSKLKIKKTKAYSAAMEKLKALYNINQIQVWILCLACERYFEREDSISLQNISDELDVPVMSIICWKKEIDFLVEHRFMEHRGRNDAILPLSDFRESIYNNTEYIPHAKKEDDDIEFISYMADRYESRRREDFTSYKNACEIAEKKGELMPILLFNEADALISKRKSDTSGNCTQTENAIQNIILEELESLKGIFIATTNLASNMDSAFERRFLFKIKFENPSTEAKTSIWMNKLSWLDKDSATEFAKEYDFSGGQIDNIVRKIAMNEVITGEHPAITDIHDMCKCEKIDNPDGTRRIGFCL